jgi:cell wall assembly regulator SMI1
MADDRLMEAELAIWKAIAASRDRHNRDLTQFFEVACEIGHFWRDLAPDGTEYPAELRAKIDALDPNKSQEKSTITT